MTTHVVTVVLDPGEITIGHCQVEGSWASSPSGPTRVPLVLSTETPAGEPALVEGLLERVGDPVPVRVGSSTSTGTELVARAVVDAAEEVVGGGAHHLLVVVPQDWLEHRSAALRRELDAAGADPVEIRPAAVTLLADAPVGTSHLVVRVATTVTASLCTRGPAGWSAARTAQAPWGSGDLDDELLGYARVRSLDPWTREQGWEARRACALAREELTERTSTEILLPGGEQVRLVRADLATLAGDHLQQALEQVVTDIGGVEEDTDVVLTGSLATHPFVTEAVTHATGRPVEPLAWPGVCSAYALAATPPAPPEQPEPVPQPEGPVPALPETRGGRHRRKGRSALTLVASGAAAALVGGVAVAGVGEAPLSSLISTVTPDGAEPGTEDTDTVSAPTTDRGGHPANAISATALPVGPDESTQEGTPRRTSTAGDPVVDPAGEPTADQETGAATSAPGSDPTTTDEAKGAGAPTRASSASRPTEDSPATKHHGKKTEHHGKKKTGEADEHARARGKKARDTGPKGSPPVHSRARAGTSEQTPATRADGKPDDPGSNGSDGSGTTPPTPSGTTDPTEEPSSPVGSDESQSPDGAMNDPSLDQ